MMSTTPPMTISVSDTSYQELADPVVTRVGIVTTEGEKLLNALRKIQTKLSKRQQLSSPSDPWPTPPLTTAGHVLNANTKTSTASVDGCHRRHVTSCAICDAYDTVDTAAAGDQHLIHTSDCVRTHHKTRLMDDNRQAVDSVDTRLKLIESQLRSISLQLTANAGNGGGFTSDTKHAVNGVDNRQSASNGRINGDRESAKRDKHLNGSAGNTNDNNHTSDDRYEASINAIRDLMRQSTNGLPTKPLSKSRSLDAINHKMSSTTAGTAYRPSKRHFHLQYKDIPFLLGTTSNSHSVIANRQLEIWRLKQHNQLCDNHNHPTNGQTNHIPVRKIFDEHIRQQGLDTEIKELLFDLHEEHDYICQEIQYLSQQLEELGAADDRRQHFQRDLYFLSRRILAKKRQINELQEMHSMLRRNANLTTANGSTSSSQSPTAKHPPAFAGHTKHVGFTNTNGGPTYRSTKSKPKASISDTDHWPKWK